MSQGTPSPASQAIWETHWSAAAGYPEATSWESCGAIAGKLYCAGGSTEAEQFPTSLASFKHFQAQLRPNLEVAPKTERFSLVDTAVPIFRA